LNCTVLVHRFAAFSCGCCEAIISHQVLFPDHVIQYVICLCYKNAFMSTALEEVKQNVIFSTKF
uniref:Uncharacterized protein n=1 Tax=Aegilops tauschii subsp. strangulata TaxID=200361 RepID=A0A453GBB6_AEGTS